MFFETESATSPITRATALFTSFFFGRISSAPSAPAARPIPMPMVRSLLFIAFSFRRAPRGRLLSPLVCAVCKKQTAAFHLLQKIH